MPLKHYHQKNTPYFITTVTKNRVEIFNDKLACQLFTTYLIYYKFKCCYNIKAFVIMPDHIHLILQPLGEDNISDIMKKLKASFSITYNKLTKSQGAIWQKGFYEKAIRDAKALNEVTEYIHYNPVRKKLVIEPKRYKFSSYNYYYENDDEFKILMIEM